MLCPGWTLFSPAYMLRDPCSPFCQLTRHFFIPISASPFCQLTRHFFYPHQRGKLMQKLFLYNKGTTIFLVEPRLKVEINKFRASLNFLINLVEKINTRSDKPQSPWNLATIQLAALRVNLTRLMQSTHLIATLKIKWDKKLTYQKYSALIFPYTSLFGWYLKLHMPLTKLVFMSL